MRRPLVRLGLAAVAVFGLVVVVRAATLDGHQVASVPMAPAPAIDETAVVERLARIVRIPTVSEETMRNVDTFDAMANALAAFPASAWLEREKRNHAIVWTWRGSNPSLNPILVLAHQDVVPIEPGTETNWSHPPFGGEISDGFVWGRGALDDKASLGAMLEAVELLHASGFVPTRTICLASSDDEEVGGVGARGLAEDWKARGVHPALVLDEGLSITKRIVPGVTSPVALLGVAEKGYATLSLDVHESGGHSSMPPRTSAIGRLAAAIARLQDNPFPITESAVRGSFLDALAPHLSFGQKLVMGNRWVFGALVDHQLSKNPASDALLRTTMAPTVVRAGTAENVLATSAHALVNFRIIPGETVQSVVARVRATIADPAIAVETLGNARDPSPTTRLDSRGYALVESVVRSEFPDTLVMPGLVLGGTDSHNFSAIADAVIRFAPLPFESEDLGRVHGTDERVAVRAYIDHIRFDAEILRRGAQADAL